MQVRNVIFDIGLHVVGERAGRRTLPSFLASIERFHMTSWPPYWCSKTMKRQPCWCNKKILWELNSFVPKT